MATQGLSFAAQVSDWCRQEKAREEAVFQLAAQMVADDVRVTIPAGGSLPIDLGNLRRSLMASTTSMPSVREGEETFVESGVQMVIEGAEIGDTVYLGFQAAYALRMEYGFVGQDSLGRNYNQRGFGFVEKTGERWPQLVKEADALVRAAVSR